MNFRFGEIFKKSFLENWVQTDVGLYNTFYTLLYVLLLVLAVFFVYRTVTKKTFYSKNFGISLVCISLITALVIMAIQSNIVISLGMVGALSIVRFRTAIKDPMDLVFLFWSISIGIVCGAHLYKAAFVATIFLTAVILMLEYIPVVHAPQILIVNIDNSIAENNVMDIVERYAKHYKIKSRNVTPERTIFTIELRCDEGQLLVRDLVKLVGVNSVNLLSHDGEVTF